jgi:hypothetical protein
VVEPTKKCAKQFIGSEKVPVSPFRNEKVPTKTGYTKKEITGQHGHR